MQNKVKTWNDRHERVLLKTVSVNKKTYTKKMAKHQSFKLIFKISHSQLNAAVVRERSSILEH